MLLGTVEKIGDALVGKTDLKVGDKIATLVSLSLTPLRIDKIKEIRPDVDQVDIDGKAILFESGIYAKIPSDLPEKLVMSALDVAGGSGTGSQTGSPRQHGADYRRSRQIRHALLLRGSQAGRRNGQSDRTLLQSRGEGAPGQSWASATR